MKRFNVSILAVVAVLAIGLTAFTKAEPTAKRVTVPNCYRTVSAAYVGNPSCTFTLIDLQPGISCTNLDLEVGKGLTAAPSNFFASLECNGSAFFCCAQLEVDNTPCTIPPAGKPIQPKVDFIDAAGTSHTGVNAAAARIAAVFCKAQAN